MTQTVEEMKNAIMARMAAYDEMRKALKTRLKDICLERDIYCHEPTDFMQDTEDGKHYIGYMITYFEGSGRLLSVKIEWEHSLAPDYKVLFDPEKIIVEDR